MSIALRNASRSPAEIADEPLVDRDPELEPGGLATRELLARVAGSASDTLRASAFVTLDLAELSRSSPRELRRLGGFDETSAARLAAAFELGRRVERATPAARAPMNAPSLVHAVAAPLLRGLDREEFHVFLLDARHRLLRTAHVSTGTLSMSLVHPREVFAAALRESAAAIVVVHNHPSGDPEPSTQDVTVTQRLVQVGTLLGVPLLDHVVVGGDRWVSLRERMSWSNE